MKVRWYRATALDGLRLVYEAYNDEDVKVAQVVRYYSTAGKTPRVEYSAWIAGGANSRMFDTVKAAKAYCEGAVAK